jgi:hypothetical protein
MRISCKQGHRMGDYPRYDQKKTSAGVEDDLISAARKAKKNILAHELLARMEKKRQENRRRARRYLVNTALLEVNGNQVAGAKVIDLSTNGARLGLPFSPPFMSQMVLKFGLPSSPKIMQVVGRVIWTRLTPKTDWYEAGVQFYQNYWELDQLLRF